MWGWTVLPGRVDEGEVVNPTYVGMDRLCRRPHGRRCGKPHVCGDGPARREELGLTREKASELLETIAPERIEKIESERSLPRPDEVLIMAEKYKTPSLCNYFCARQCPIGQQYVPEIRSSELSDIVLKMLASLNAMDRKKERLIEIAADGTISKDEIDDFVRIQKELERISVTVETLQLWVEKMLANGRIDTEAYNKESEVP